MKSGEVVIDAEQLRTAIGRWYDLAPRPESLLPAVRAATLWVPIDDDHTPTLIRRGGLLWMLAFTSTAELVAFRDQRGAHGELMCRRVSGAFLLDEFRSMYITEEPVVVLLDAAGTRPFSVPLSPSLGSTTATRPNSLRGAP